jgi:hypothetical protein
MVAEAAVGKYSLMITKKQTNSINGALRYEK